MSIWPGRILVSLALIVTASPPVVAQSVPQIAINACSTAVTRVAKSTYGANHVVVANQRTSPISSTLRGVQGDGSFDQSGLNQRFTFHCAFDTASGTTRDTDLRLRNSPPPKPASSNASGALAAGLAVGLIAGAIIGSAADKDKHHKDKSVWWSPHEGVECNSSQDVCHKDGRYSASWTRKVYGF